LEKILEQQAALLGQNPAGYEKRMVQQSIAAQAVF